ncbi:cold shock domain-containing protein [Acinetobacter chinensis]|uniref:Cold shock domain-containing protein n=1 Tax=Acinetobacter chinensis TaxID=2004650 RepID=A0ABU3WFG1_9GAMM|nr:cold shock domain-containing protein [Acinetobacter chinensis]MDV2468926.1 cold shock domain-containing protein [Acinetobacter chinensis]
MFIEGIVKTYNAERGFGFIQCEDNRKDIFFHISDFPNKNQPPQIGEKLKFYVDQNDGKARAKNIVRLDIKSSQLGSTGRIQSTKSKPQNDRGVNLINLFISVGIIAIFISLFIPFATDMYTREKLKKEPVNSSDSMIISSEINSNNSTSNYHCDGRTHCSQMTSYEEAVYFINHCPGTKMDGDGDGVPCESQFYK